MKQIKISAAYAEHASVERYKRTPDERTICVPITLGLGFSFVITECMGQPEHSALLTFFVSGDHPQMPKIQLKCERKITQSQLNSIIDALAETETDHLKDAITDMFWLPPELRAGAKTKPRAVVKTKRPVIDQPDLFAMA